MTMWIDESGDKRVQKTLCSFILHAVFFRAFLGKASFCNMVVHVQKSCRITLTALAPFATTSTKMQRLFFLFCCAPNLLHHVFAFLFPTSFLFFVDLHQSTNVSIAMDEAENCRAESCRFFVARCTTHKRGAIFVKIVAHNFENMC